MKLIDSLLKYDLLKGLKGKKLRKIGGKIAVISLAAAFSWFVYSLLNPKIESHPPPVEMHPSYAYSGIEEKVDRLFFVRGSFVRSRRIWLRQNERDTMVLDAEDGREEWPCLLKDKNGKEYIYFICHNYDNNQGIRIARVLYSGNPLGKIELKEENFLTPPKGDWHYITVSPIGKLVTGGWDNKGTEIGIYLDDKLLLEGEHTNITFSKDGSKLYFVDKGYIYEKNISDESEPIKFSENSGYNYIAMIYTGRYEGKMVSLRGTEKGIDLFISEPDGTDMKQLTFDSGSKEDLAVGSKQASFVVGREIRTYDLINNKYVEVKK